MSAVSVCLTVSGGAIRWEEEKSEQLELFCRIFNQGEFKAEEQESALAELNERVTEVYTVILGENQANISTLQMLASLESHIEDMFGYLETVPADRLHTAEKVSRPAAASRCCCVVVAVFSLSSCHLRCRRWGLLRSRSTLEYLAAATRAAAPDLLRSRVDSPLLKATSEDACLSNRFHRENSPTTLGNE